VVIGASEASAVAEDARGKGDAVWVVPRTEYVSASPTVSLGDLMPPEKQLQVAKDALDSFGSSESAKVRRDAVELARRVLGLKRGPEPAS